MADSQGHLFLSYAQEDRPRIQAVAEALAHDGWRVWWDRENLPPGQQFHRVIAEAIQASACVLVFWSESSVDSGWVIDEANEAKNLNKYLPVLLDKSRPPLGLRSYHFLNLSSWDGAPTNGDYPRLVKAITDYAPKPDTAVTSTPEETAPRGSAKPRPANRKADRQGRKRTEKPETGFSSEVEGLLAEIADLGTEPKHRLEIGDRLAQLRDPRPGVGLNTAGLPDIDWVEIAAGSFLYGDDKERRELPTFYIACYPITNVQYSAFIDAGGYRDDRWWEGLAKRIKSPEKPGWDIVNRPRETVSWYEAMAFCRWLSDELGYEVRLPTEMEWERAARGTDGREYPWGDEYRSGYANVNEKTAEQGEHNLKETTAIGLYPQGAWPDGAQDLIGNVWEWCLNEYNNLKRIDSGGAAVRALRGGSWLGNPVDARASFRNWYLPDLRNSLIGFRVMCSSPIAR